MIIARDVKIVPRAAGEWDNTSLAITLFARVAYNIFSTIEQKNVVFNSFLCKLGFFGTCGPLKRSFHSRFKLAHYFVHYYTEGEEELLYLLLL
jgi:hypothetical protein